MKGYANAGRETCRVADSVVQRNTLWSCAANGQVRLPENTQISDEKLTKYLLAPRKRNDKSNWLAQAGYLLENWSILRDDLKRQVLPNDALLVETTDYGTMYEIRANLRGPNGKTLPVCTIWMVGTADDVARFITMYPDRKR